MSLADISNGPAWILWTVFVIFAIISIALLTGRCENLIAGYNTSTEDEKGMYDTKKLCRVGGTGISIITFMIFIMAVGKSFLPASFATFFLTITLIDCFTIIILANTICKN